jgi:TRAP-type C4-dicarboxylate transport system permease large subunit
LTLGAIIRKSQQQHDWTRLRIATMGNLPILLQVLSFLALVVVGIALSLAPIVWIARRILAPIDRAAKFRQAPVRFSIGDFLCLFLAIQIPLAGAHRFIGEETMEYYWTFTIVTWLVAPVIWFVGARTLSKAVRPQLSAGYYYRHG